MTLATAVGKMVKIGLKEAVAYRAELVIWLLTTNMPLIMMAFWWTIADEAPVGRYDGPAFVRYFSAVLITRLLTGAWIVWTMHMEIRQGRFNQRLLVPFPPLASYALENLAVYPLRLVFLAPIFAVYVALGGLRASGWTGALAFVPTVLMAWSINFLAMSVVAALGMVWEKSQSLFDVWLGMYFALSGYLVPLDLFPAWLRGITDALPFRYMISVPARILTGDISGAAVLAAWLGQFAWIAVFGLLSSVAWRFGLKRWVAMGG